MNSVKLVLKQQTQENITNYISTAVSQTLNYTKTVEVTNLTTQSAIGLTVSGVSAILGLIGSEQVSGKLVSIERKLDSIARDIASLKQDIWYLSLAVARLGDLIEKVGDQLLEDNERIVISELEGAGNDLRRRLELNKRNPERSKESIRKACEAVRANIDRIVSLGNPGFYVAVVVAYLLFREGWNEIKGNKEYFKAFRGTVVKYLENAIGDDYSGDVENDPLRRLPIPLAVRRLRSEIDRELINAHPPKMKYYSRSRGRFLLESPQGLWTYYQRPLPAKEGFAAIRAGRHPHSNDQLFHMSLTNTLKEKGKPKGRIIIRGGAYGIYGIIKEDKRQFQLVELILDVEYVNRAWVSYAKKPKGKGAPKESGGGNLSYTNLYKRWRLDNSGRRKQCEDVMQRKLNKANTILRRIESLAAIEAGIEVALLEI